MNIAYGIAWPAAIGSGMIQFLIPGVVKAILSSAVALVVVKALPTRILTKLHA
jgi:hypothetical protein